MPDPRRPRILPDLRMKLPTFIHCALLAAPLAFAAEIATPKLSPEEKARFEEAAEYSKAARGLSLLVMRDGDIIFEDYAPIWNADKPHLLGTGTMSFVGVLAACAAHDGLLDFDEKVSDTLVEWKDGGSKEQVTIRQLLGMGGGIEGANATNALPTYRNAVRQAEATAAPGERFSFGPMPMQCFGELLRRKLAPQNLAVGEYLERRLLAPMGLRVGFWNSVTILIPSVIVSIAVGAINGYALAFWNPPGGKLLFMMLLLGAFIPYAIFIYPLVRILSWLGLYGTLPAIVIIHTVFGLPTMTILFRNFFASLPPELFKAARVDGAGFVRVFTAIMLPMSLPILVVAVILQVTGIWNDFLLGLVFAGRENLPMTVQLNNIVNSSQGERAYNVEMAATMLTALVPLAVYFFSGRWFVRGIAAGAVKG